MKKAILSVLLITLLIFFSVLMTAAVLTSSPAALGIYVLLLILVGLSIRSIFKKI